MFVVVQRQAPMVHSVNENPRRFSGGSLTGSTSWLQRRGESPAESEHLEFPFRGQGEM